MKKRMILGMLDSDGGDVLWNGERLTFDNCNIGYLAEERGLYPKRKVLEQMVYLARLRGISKKQATENSIKWLKRLEVEEYANRELETLSKGNQQKVQLSSLDTQDGHLGFPETKKQFFSRIIRF